METKTQVQRPPMFALVDAFKWRDRQGNFHRVEDMETRHLFHVVRMVWDHSMPKEWQTRFPRRYRFSEFYSEDYMALAVRLMLPALLHRPNLTPEMWYWVEYMRRCLTDERLNVPFMRKIAYEEK